MRRRPIIEFGPAPRFIDQPDLFGPRINLPGITICFAPWRSHEAARTAVAETNASLKAENDRLRQDIREAREAITEAQHALLFGGEE